MKILKYASVIPIILLLSLLAILQIFLPTVSKVVNYGEKHKDCSISIIKHFEGFRQYPYKDNDGTIKIGYGFPADGRTSITEIEATEILEYKVETIALEIRQTAEKNNIYLETFHIYALTSLSYNIGQRNVDKILADWTLITDTEILKYVYAKVDGKYVILRGIPPRRIAEAGLFNDEKCAIL